MNNLLKFISIFYLSISTISAFAFNWEKCQELLNEDKSMTGGAAFGSTTSFLSSFGKCSMLGDLKHDRRVFYVHNFHLMKTEFAKGNGEYTAAFAKLYGCNNEAQQKFPQIIKPHLSIFLENEADVPTEGKFQRLEDFFSSDSFLFTNCGYRT